MNTFKQDQVPKLIRMKRIQNHGKFTFTTYIERSVRLFDYEKD